MLCSIPSMGTRRGSFPSPASTGPKVLHAVLGDSIARWEGDTLVIETISLPDGDRKRSFANNMMVPGDSRVIERLTRAVER